MQGTRTHALVTGGGGFLGRYIVEQLLARGDQVTVFARGNYPELEQLGATLTRGDIRDLDSITQATRDIDVVYHAAAKAGLWGPRSAFYEVNVTGTENVIAACRAHGVAKLIYTSSPSVIFDGTDQCGVDEAYPYPDHYENPYPETKALGEQLVREANGDDLLTTSLRPHLIFGPGDNHLLPALLRRAEQGRVPQVGNGTNRVDLTYVEDAAAAHLLAADALIPGSAAAGAPGAGTVYFVSQGEPVTLWPWIRNLLAQLDLPPIRVRIPLWAARAAGAVLAAVYRTFPLKGEPPLTPFLASELAQDHYYDIGRAERELGYRPSHTMERATQKTLAWLKTKAPSKGQESDRRQTGARREKAAEQEVTYGTETR